MSTHATITADYPDGITINLSREAAEAIAVVLGRVVDLTDAGASEEVYNVLVDAGFDESLSGNWPDTDRKYSVTVEEQAGEYGENEDKYLVSIVEADNA
jgi:hypothetical protein